MSKLFVVLLACLHIVGGFAQLLVNPPTIYWSMDTIEGTRLRPDVGDITNWSGDLSKINGTFVTTGVDGHALVLDKVGINVADDLRVREDECLFTPTLCDGLTVAMWLNVKEWTDLIDWIFWTGADGFRYPGIAIFPDPIDRISLSVKVALPDGTLYEASVSQDIVGTDIWTHVATTWSQANGVKIYLNGTEASAYTKAPTIGTTAVSGSSGRRLPLRFGDNEMSFAMDELKVWYRELDASQVSQTPVPGVNTEIATTNVATTTAPTTAPATTTVTTMPTEPVTTATVTVMSTAAVATTTMTAVATTALPNAEVTSSNTDAATTAMATTIPTTSSTTTAMSPPVATTNSLVTDPVTPATTTTLPLVTTTTVRPAPITTTSMSVTRTSTPTTTTTSTTSSTTTTPRPPDSTAVNPEGSWSTTTIVGISVGVGVILLLIIIITIIFCCCTKSRRETGYYA